MTKLIIEKTTLAAHCDAIFQHARSELGNLIEIVSAGSELEHTLLSGFHALRAEVSRELGPIDNLQELEQALASRLRAVLKDPAHLAEVIAELVPHVRDVLAELAGVAPPSSPEPDDGEAPTEAPAGVPEAPAAEPGGHWEYVRDEGGIITGTRPVAPPAPEPPSAETPAEASQPGARAQADSAT